MGVGRCANHRQGFVVGRLIDVLDKQIAAVAAVPARTYLFSK